MISAADIITCSRIRFSIGISFFPPFSPQFFALYCAAGFTDMIDGVIARKTHSVSEFGAVLDTFADIVFVLVCFIKFIPVIEIPVWLYVWIAVIALIKTVNIISGYAVEKKFVTLHTVMNKVTGILLFVLPFTFSFIQLKYSAVFVCIAATFAAVQEGHFIRTGEK